MFVRKLLSFHFNSSVSYWEQLAFGGSRIIASLFSVWLVGRLLDKRKMKDFGFHFNKDWWIDLAFGLGLGVILMTTIFLVELSAGWIVIKEFAFVGPEDKSFIPSITVFFIVLVFAGTNEELNYRAYFLTNAAEGFNYKSIGPKKAVIIAWVFSCVFFGVFHIGNPNATLFSTLNIMLAGVALGLGFVMTGSMAIPIGIHITWNFFQGNVFGFPISGNTVFMESASFFRIEQLGSDSITGGAFGPEGGMLCTLALLIGIALTLLWHHYRYGIKWNEIYSPIAILPLN